MNDQWKNIGKFPKFFISVMLGFFLTTLKPIFRLLENKRLKIITIMLTVTFISALYITIKLMLDIK
uniref:Uncharacterized protein ycf33 n=1 Tax=Crouania attenuata TaxID=42002 RepID=A0A4D6WQS5_9FLOR|nr:hypothetical protein [Crouania attenuata]